MGGGKGIHKYTRSRGFQIMVNKIPFSGSNRLSCRVTIRVKVS